MNHKIYICLIIAGVLFNLSPILYVSKYEGRSPASFDSANAIYILESNPALIIH